MNMRWKACLLVVTILVAGCGQAATVSTEPPAGPDSVSVQQCGSETFMHGNGYDAAKRNCLWQAVRDGTPADLTSTVYTIEGDPISYTLEALAPSHGPGPRFTLLVDSKDRFGKMGQFRYDCKSLQRVEYPYQGEQRYRFHLSECTGTEGQPEVDFP